MADAVHIHHGFNLGWLQMRAPDSSADMLGNEMNTGEAESVDRGTARHGVLCTEYFATGPLQGLIPGTIGFSRS